MSWLPAAYSELRVWMRDNRYGDNPCAGRDRVRQRLNEWFHACGSGLYKPSGLASHHAASRLIEFWHQHGGAPIDGAPRVWVPPTAYPQDHEGVRLPANEPDPAPIGCDGDSQAAPVVSPLPPDETAEELVERLCATRERRFARERAKLLRRVVINDPLPIGICHLGDPHLDDDYCDLSMVRRVVDTIRDTPGLYVGTVGDDQNAWIGRLARLYAYQGTTKAEARKLVEWMFTQLRGSWIYGCRGNHDAWDEADPLRSLMPTDNFVTGEAEVMFDLVTPRGQQRIWIRHDFPGHSQWNPVHGLTKALRMKRQDVSLAVCGHKHIAALAVESRDNPEVPWFAALRVAGFKVFDEYATRLGYANGIRGGEAAVTIHRPWDKGPDGIKVFMDPFEGAEYLTWARRKAAA